MGRILFIGMFVLSGLVVNANAAAPTGRYKTALDALKTLQEKYPQISYLYSIGANDEGTDIMAMRISTTPTTMDPKKIGHLVVSTHHGNELKTVDFTLAFVDKLLQRYQSEELYRGQLADQEWTVIPVLNISGYNANNRYEKGQDPNRDYPGPCITAPGGKLKSTSLLRELMTKRIYTGSLTVHGYLGALTYPWGVDVSNTHSFDHNAFEKVTKKAADIAGYRQGTSTDIVYPCDGAFEDYAYWKHGTWSLLLELETGSASDIQATVAGTQSYFDELDSSPSVKHNLASNCQRSGRLDLGIE